ncbi:MAG: hypothetical protein H0W63_04575 [Gemmatimonadaceae bacterium]|nr:hypothetical protein [Gemmatimonadaceae bacterium]
MHNNDGHQKGPQDHAEGGHGQKTRNKILEQLHSGKTHQAEKEPVEHPGDHRLVAHRQQHDAAEKRSEKTRLSRDIERHRLPDEKA